MNIEQFRARVAESAAAAHKAARHLSSLDEMAEKDEYIQSPDLNVKTKKGLLMGQESSSSSFSDAPNSSSAIPAVVEDLSTRFVDVISKAARSSPSRSGASSTASSRVSTPPLLCTQSPTLELTAKKAEKAKLMPSVAAVYAKQNNNRPKQKTQSQQQSNKQHDPIAPKVNHINEKHAFILQQLDYDSDSDNSSNGEQYKDSQSQSRNALHEKLEYELNECISNQESSSLSNNAEKKDPNRFMKMAADLESERKALIANNTTTSKQDCEDGRGGLWGNNNTTLRSGTAGDETNKALKAGLSWVQNVATPQLNAISQHILTKVADNSQSSSSSSSSSSSNASGPIISSRSKLRYRDSDDEENITMTTSSTFLSADDIAEFEQMRSKTSHSMISAMVLPLVEAIRGNHRLAFVVLTLLFSLFAYFYSRKRSVDDVL